MTSIAAKTVSLIEVTQKNVRLILTIPVELNYLFIAIWIFGPHHPESLGQQISKDSDQRKLVAGDSNACILIFGGPKWTFARLQKN
jgi:hypothetical protein